MGNRDDRRTRKRSRAGALIRAHLDWLDGFPVESADVRIARWQTVPRDGREGTIVELDGRTRSRALRAARTLVRDEPEVLERMLPDPTRWLRAVELATHGDTPDSLYSARELALLCSVPRAFRWICAAHGDLDLVKAWLEHQPMFEAITHHVDFPFAVQVCRLCTRVRRDTIMPLLQTLCDPLTYEVSTAHPPKGWERTPPTPIPRGPSRLVEPLLRMVRVALDAEPKQASAICALWGAMEPSFMLREWNAFWVRLENTRHRVETELRAAFEQRRATKIAGELKRTMGGAPAGLVMDKVFDDIVRISKRPVVAHAAARALKRAVAPGSPLPTTASCTTRRAHRGKRSRSRWDACAAALHQWSQSDWSDEVATSLIGAVVADPFDLELLSLLKRSNAKTLQPVLAASKLVDVNSLNWSTLESLVNAGATAEQAAALQDLAHNACFESLKAALHLTDDIEALRNILPRLRERPWSEADALRRLPMVRDRFRAEQLKHWIVLARHALGLDPRTTLSIRPAPIDTDRAWIDEFPSALHQALEAFATTEPNAQTRATKLLRPDIRSTDDLQHELARLPESAVKRRAMLQERLANPTQPTPARLQRLAQRLEAATDLAFVQRWTANVIEHLKQHARVDVDVELLAAFGTLKRPFRRLAERVVREGDLRDAPGNAAYLKRMREFGINMDPWLDGIGAHRWARWVYALENNPAEVLKMGGYFQTCLSPGAFNFYAAVVDAADVNKRVLYARDQQGVAGRVLLALDARGELVRYDTFHREFTETMNDGMSAFIDKLIDRMGTRYAQNPDFIELLMSDSWYCDGPLPAPEGDALLQLIQQAKEDELVTSIRNEFGLGAITLMAVIERLSKAPTKAEPVLRVALECQEQLPDQTLRSAAKLAQDLKLWTLAGDLVASRAARLLWTRYRSLDHFVASVLLKRDPNELLRQLRKNRRGAWRRENRPSVLLYAGRAYLATSRRHKAREVLQLARQRGSKAAARALATL